MSHHYNRHHSGPYRSRNRVLLGVCGGLAEHYDFSAFWMRVLFLIAFAATGLYPAAVAYVIAGLIMKVEPVLALRNDGDTEFYNSYTTSRPMALSRLRSTFDNLDMRIQRIENVITNREYDWDQRLRNG